RPTFLRLNDERVIIGVDIRPTQTTVAMADANGKFTSQESMVTPRDPKAGMASLIAAIRRIAASAGRKKIEGIGVSLPGRFDAGAGRLVFAPNLGWHDVDIGNPIAK